MPPLFSALCLFPSATAAAALSPLPPQPNCSTPTSFLQAGGDFDRLPIVPGCLALFSYPLVSLTFSDANVCIGACSALRKRATGFGADHANALHTLGDMMLTGIYSVQDLEGQIQSGKRQEVNTVVRGRHAPSDSCLSTLITGSKFWEYQLA